ncbi:DUF4232 domain-containing protein [Streptomyces heilongjiangensis]|uniref:DUF4232 domain-containing protein n=1 Tax=Streptomyces heilongjiangensis TaxID=945052 RepID=A0ABW1BCX2_9ACTN|nr:DUF4232 domain-containing protein [Streptomyces heilongjiangensis]MDC2952093.1 DUF4232 domain-containing protein [Streptomyces heilongjiangensis]
MRTYRTARTARISRRSRLLVGAAGAALAALSLTACGDGTGTKDEGSAHPSLSAAEGSRQTDADKGTDSGTRTGAGTDTGTGTGTGTGGTKTSPDGRTDAETSAAGGPQGGRSAGQGEGAVDQASRKGGDPFDPANRVTCNGSNTAVTMQPVARPLNHMLITVKNTGSKVCDLYYYPTVRFDQVQWAPRIVEESQPQAVVTLAPGESGYAGVLLSAADGSGENGATAKKVTIRFQGRNQGSDGGATASPSLPAKGVYYDSTLAVTYWQSTIDDALMY